MRREIVVTPKALLWLATLILVLALMIGHA
jgi:hypothetical protein